MRARKLALLFLALWSAKSFAPGLQIDACLTNSGFIFADAWAGKAATVLASASGARFCVDGNTGTYSIGTNQATATLTRQGGTETITVNTFTFSSNNNLTLVAGSCCTGQSGCSSCTCGQGSCGGDTAYVGASHAALSSTQVAGLYTGSINVKFTLDAQNKKDVNSVPIQLRVLTSITLTLNAGSSIAFGQTWRGAAAQTIAPASGASLSAAGETGHAFSVVLPQTSINMTTTGTNGATTTISVGSFTSSVTSTTLPSTVKVGATRGAIATNQAYGDYTGSFTVTVSY